MKFPLRLPLCPYCEARFLYGDVKSAQRRKEIACPHCGKTILVKGQTGRAVFYTIAALVLIGLNLLLLQVPSMNLLYLVIVTAGLVWGAWLLTPCTVRFRAAGAKDRGRKKN